MPTVVEKNAIRRARSLRRAMTSGEKRLWGELREFRRHYGLHARRQVPIGAYVVDFAIQSAKLVIEVDGEHHFTPEGIRKDSMRDLWLTDRGYKVLRFNTGEIANSLDGCVEQVLRELKLWR